MIFYKAWLESRGRFFSGLIAIAMITILFIWLHHILIPGWKLAHAEPNTIKPPWLSLGVYDFRFYAWHFLYDFRMQQAWVFFAVLLSFGGLTREYIEGTVSFTLTLPVTRKWWIYSRLFVVFLESVAIGLIPALIIPLAGAYFGLHYPISQGIAHSLLMVAAGSTFIILANFISMLIRSSYYVAIGLALFILGFPYIVLQEYAREISKNSLAYHFDIAHIMSGPWLLTWANTPWLSIVILFIISSVALTLAVRYTKKADY